MTLAILDRNESLLEGWPGQATSTGYILQDGLKYDDFRILLDHLLTMQQSSGWWLGDLLIKFEGSHGQTYLAALPDRRENPSRYQACRDAKWVCREFQLSRRRDKLSFSHHREVAPLEPDEQDLWLTRAQENRWGVHRLRDELRAAKKPAVDGDAPDLLRGEGFGQSTTARVPSASDRMVNDFLGDADDDSEEDGGEVEADAPTLPGGHLIIPADAALLASVMEALSVEACMTGTICSPVVVYGRPWCPLRRSEEASDNSLEFLAIRVVPIERYVEENYQARYPLCTVEVWQQEVAEGRRVPTDYSGLCVRVDVTGEKWVLLHQRATFRGKRSYVGETPQEAVESTAPVAAPWSAADPPTSMDAVPTAQPPSSATVENVGHSVGVSPSGWDKLQHLCDRYQLLPAGVVDMMIDAWYESAVRILASSDEDEGDD